MNSPRMFISHSHVDDEFGHRLVDDLRARFGSDEIWYDSRGGLKPGDDWWRRIVAEITARDVFIIVYSPDALNSPWVINEIEIAWAQRNNVGTLFVPIMYRTVDLRADWSLIHYVSFVDRPYGEAFEDLLRALPSATQTPVQKVEPLDPMAQLIKDQTLDIHAEFGFKHWDAVTEKTQILISEAPLAMSPALWRERGFAFLELSEGTSALIALNKALATDKFNVATLRGKGLALRQIGRLDESATELERAYNLTLVGETALKLTLLEDLTETQLQAGAWTSALRWIEKAVELAPKTDERWLSLKLDTMSRIGDGSSALSFARDLGNTNRDLISPWAQQRFGDFSSVGDWSQALRVIDVIINLLPNDITWYSKKLDSLVAVGRLSEAYTYAREIAPRFPSVINTWLENRFQESFDAARWQDTRTAIDLGLAVTTDRSAWLKREILMLYAQPVYDAALEATRKLVTEFKSDKAAWLLLAQVAAKAGSEREVERGIDGAISLSHYDDPAIEQSRKEYLRPLEVATAHRRTIQFWAASVVALCGSIACSVGILDHIEIPSWIVIMLGAIAWIPIALVGSYFTYRALTETASLKQWRWFFILIILWPLALPAIPLLGAFLYYVQGPGGTYKQHWNLEERKRRSETRSRVTQQPTPYSPSYIPAPPSTPGTRLKPPAPPSTPGTRLKPPAPPSTPGTRPKPTPGTLEGGMDWDRPLW